MNIKKTVITSGAVLGMALCAVASIPHYTTLSHGGNAASPSEVIFPADPGNQIRIVGVSYGSDSNTAGIFFSGGATLLTTVETNQLTTSITNKVTSTNGLSANCIAVLQHAGACYSTTVTNWNSSTNAGIYGGTNIVITGGWGVNASVGDNVYIMDAGVTVPVGLGTNYIGGPAIYSAALPGRPVRAVLKPALTTNNLNSVVARYE